MSLETRIGRGKRLLVGASLTVAALGWGFRYFLLTDALAPPVRTLSGHIQRDVIRIAGQERSYLYYVPAILKERPFLLLALHGARGTGRRIRIQTAYEFDQLADRDSAIIVYPDGVKGYWNDCRRALAERRTVGHAVDDIAFLRALIDRFRTDFDVAAVFVMGFSNGGEMAYRLALEQPDAVAGIAAVAANLPTPDNSVCALPGRPVPALIVAGTEDPINPYDGGASGWFGLGNGGPVQSAMATAAYFSRLAGYDRELPTHDEVGREGDQPAWVERTTWQRRGAPEVALYTIHGGGHTIPQSRYRFRRILGRTVTSIDCMQEVWDFFRRAYRASGPPDAMVPNARLLPPRAQGGFRP